MTVARWQRWAVALQLLLCLSYLVWALRFGWLGWLVALALVPVGLRMPLAVQCLLAARASGPRPGLRAWLRVWWHEGVWAGRVFGWWQPFRSAAVADGLQAARPGRGIVLVHGFGCNRGFWMPWLRRLRAQDRAFAAVTLEPPLGSIDAYVQAIDGAVRRMADATGMAPLVVAHSMGGLAVRAWMRAAADADARVHRVITLAAPHQGTPAARFAFSPNARQMRPGSPWLRELAASEPPERRTLFECWRTDTDNVVYPLGAALLDGATAHTLHGLGHVQLAFDPRVMQAVWARLRE